MNRLNFTKIILIIALIACPTMFYGQNSGVKKNGFTDFENYLYVSGDLGIGALSADNSGFKVRPNGHLGFGYQFDNILGAKLNLGYGALNGNYGNRTIEKSNYFEASISLTANVVDIILGYDSDRNYSVNPHIGVGQIHYQTHLVDAEGNTLYRVGFNENGSIKGDGINRRKVVATVPMGIEVNYNFAPNWSAYADFTASYADTDALDGVFSGKNDWFASFNLGAIYKLKGKANILQDNNEYCNHWFAMLDGGASYIFGDNKFNFNDVNGNGNIGIGYNFSNNYRFYAKFGFGMYNANEASSFTLKYGDYYEVNFNLAADLVGIIFGYNDTRRVALYPHIGIGQMQYKATTILDEGGSIQVGYNNDNSNNRRGDGLYGRRVALTIPMGLEFTYKINNTYEAYMDATTTFADTDLLDAVSSGKSRDRHAAINIGFRYKFNKSCFVVEEPVEVPECITPEEIKDAIKNAIKEQEAASTEAIKAAIAEAAVEDSVVYNKNFTNIVFPINKSEKIDTQTNIDALNRASKEMKDGSAVNKIIVEGYASPDGSKELNDRLAQERAEEAAELVKKELGTNVEIEINSKGADWDGLIKAIEGSDLENKADIANQIKNSSNREQTLRELMAKYPQIKKLLPQLRRAGVTITTVK